MSNAFSAVAFMLSVALFVFFFQRLLEVDDLESTEQACLLAMAAGAVVMAIGFFFGAVP